MQAAWIGGIGFVVLKLAFLFFGQTDAAIATEAAKYTFVRDANNRVVDIGYKPIVDQALRARARAAQLQDGEL